MTVKHILGGVAVVLLLPLSAGCMSTRSISDTGFGYYGHSDLYKGELSDFSVIGIDPKAHITDQQIAAEFGTSHKLHFKPGSSVLLVQSGALIPDDPMLSEMEKHYKVGPMSGVPAGKPSQAQTANLSKAFRLAAAEGGYDYILVYWGVLEGEQKNLATKGISWVPILGKSVPDQTQRMRIRLKAILIDAHTGHWNMLLPPPAVTKITTTRRNREQMDQSQVQALKKEGYTALVKLILKKYGG